ncbi:hypothetical protein GCM10018782_35810 [Streptomyces griseoaurantiacus]|nr:hypothetical protein GCM10018782_35810 [Streptomyces griseoaurantiacus]
MPRVLPVLRGVLRALRGLRGLRGLPHALLGVPVPLVLAHRLARHPSPSSRSRWDREDPDRGRRGRAARDARLPPLPADREADRGRLVLRMRPGLLGDAVDAFRRARRPDRAAVASGGRFPCAALFVLHRPVPVRHAGPGPAPRCL